MESQHEITYKWFYGSISEEDYDNLYNKLYEFIELKFGDDVDKNSHTPIPIRNWHKTLWFDMINAGQAAFFVIYDGKEPINVSLNYMAENIIFSMIPAYNLDYMQYGIGNIQNLKIIEWAINKGYEYYDLGKVSYGYKRNWSNLEHSYEYHVIFNRKSLMSSVLGLALYSYYSTKQFLRKKYHTLRGYK
jgi:hypothetical protein